MKRDVLGFGVCSKLFKLLESLKDMTLFRFEVEAEGESEKVQRFLSRVSIKGPRISRLMGNAILPEASRVNRG